MFVNATKEGSRSDTELSDDTARPRLSPFTLQSTERAYELRRVNKLYCVLQHRYVFVLNNNDKSE